MHPASIALIGVAVCFVAYHSFRTCARNQRAGFLDRPSPRRTIVYQALPTTQV